MVSTNKYAGEVKATLAGKERKFKLTFERLVFIEENLNKTVMELTKEYSTGQYSMKSITEVLYQSLLGGGGRYEKSSVGQMIMDDGLIKGAEIASKILTTLFTNEDEDSENPLVQGEKQSKEDTQSKNT